MAAVFYAINVPLSKLQLKEIGPTMMAAFFYHRRKKAGSGPDKDVVYFPGRGSRRWQLPYKSSIKH